MMPRHSFTTRFLLTCIRSKLFYKEQTTDDIFVEIGKQANGMCRNGLRDALKQFNMILILASALLKVSFFKITPVDRLRNDQSLIRLWLKITFETKFGMYHWKW